MTVVAPLYTTCWGLLKQPDNQKTASRGQHARPGLCVHLVLPHLVAGLGVKRPDCAIARIVRDIDIRYAPHVSVARRIFRLAFQIITLVLPHTEIKVAGERVVRRRVPVRRTLNTGPDVGAFLGRNGVREAFDTETMPAMVSDGRITTDILLCGALHQPRIRDKCRGRRPPLSPILAGP